MKFLRLKSAYWVGLTKNVKAHYGAQIFSEQGAKRAHEKKVSCV